MVEPWSMMIPLPLGAREPIFDNSLRLTDTAVSHNCQLTRVFSILEWRRNIRSHVRFISLVWVNLKWEKTVWDEITFSIMGGYKWGCKEISSQSDASDEKCLLSDFQQSDDNSTVVTILVHNHIYIHYKYFFLRGAGRSSFFKITQRR